MSYEMDAAAAARLDGYLTHVGTHLKDRRKRQSFAMYAYGLLGDGERKSAEPIAARACGVPERTKRAHDKVLHFLARSQWDDHAVRLASARYAIEALSPREPITTWMVDDTGFLKQGKHSVGVQRQSTGTAGKVTNCQVGVSLAIATRTEHLPLDFELYLPQAWTEDAARRRDVRIPEHVHFKSKIDLALGMIARAASAGIAGEIILADAAYGGSAEFRNAVGVLGFDFAVQVQSNTCVVPLDARGQLTGCTLSLLQLTQGKGRKAFRRVTWREGARRTLHSTFLFVRVKTAGDDGFRLEEHEPLWAILEWPDDEAKPSKFFLTTLPRRMTRKQIVRVVKERWRIERMFEDLKGELGLDHFEGRSFPGWHHHVSVVLCGYAFVVAERARTFPPSTRGADLPDAFVVAA